MPIGNKSSPALRLEGTCCRSSSTPGSDGQIGFMIYTCPRILHGKQGRIKKKELWPNEVKKREVATVRSHKR